MARIDSSVGIKVQYTFDQLIVGSHNQMAAAASLQVSKQLGEAYNPLFLYGPTGVGKTHMMQAIAHAALAENPNFKVKYISAERFVNEVISSIAEDNLVGLRQHYGQLDLLLIDDIQFILESRSTQGEFLHVFNNLHQQNRQVVLTCDRAPSQLTALDKSIRSRLEWGLATDIKVPDLATRMEILRLKQKNYGITLSDESIRYISELLNSNVRELEGFLKRLHAYVTLSHQEVTTELIQSVLSEVIPGGTESRMPTAETQEVPSKGTPPILASMMDAALSAQPVAAPVPQPPPSIPKTRTPEPVASEPIAPTPIQEPSRVPDPMFPEPPAPPISHEIPVPTSFNGASRTNGAHELDETFNKLPDLPSAKPPVVAPEPIAATPVVPEPIAPTPPLPEPVAEAAPADMNAIPTIVKRVFPPAAPPVEPVAPAASVAPPAPVKPAAKEFKKAPIIAPVIVDDGVPPAPPSRTPIEVKKAPLIPPTMDDTPAVAAPAADRPMTEEEMDAEPLPAGHKEIFSVFFYPDGYESQLNTVVKKFQEVVKKHKLKFRLRRVNNQMYNHKGKIDYNSFVDVCKKNKVPVAIVIGPPPSGSVVTEHEFYDLLSVTLDVQGVSLQMVSWSEIDKDYRYLNLALDIALVRAGRA